MVLMWLEDGEERLDLAPEMRRKAYRLMFSNGQQEVSWHVGKDADAVYLIAGLRELAARMEAEWL